MPQELIRTKEAAEILGLEPMRMAIWRTLNNVGPPFKYDGYRKAVYLKDDVVNWRLRTGGRYFGETWRKYLTDKYPTQDDMEAKIFSMKVLCKILLWAEWVLCKSMREANAPGD